MALTDFEKACIDDIHSHLMRTGRNNPALNTIKHGTEAERQALIVGWINGPHGTAATNSLIADIDAQIAELNARKAELQTKKTDMENYVA